MDGKKDIITKRSKDIMNLFKNDGTKVNMMVEEELSSNYIKLENGILIYFGIHLVRANETNTTVSFPIPFSQANYTTIATYTYSTDVFAFVTTGVKTTTTCRIYASGRDYGNNNDMLVNLICIGRWK